MRGFLSCPKVKCWHSAAVTAVKVLNHIVVVRVIGIFAYHKAVAVRSELPVTFLKLLKAAKI